MVCKGFKLCTFSVGAAGGSMIQDFVLFYDHNAARQAASLGGKTSRLLSAAGVFQMFSRCFLNVLQLF